MNESMEILEKSEMEVCNGSEKVESQTKSLSSIAVGVLFSWQVKPRVL